MIDSSSTIRITKSTKEKLKNYKLTPGESYENIILRLIEFYENNK